LHDPGLHDLGSPGPVGHLPQGWPNGEFAKLEILFLPQVDARRVVQRRSFPIGK